jgi:hypothetical protein
MLNEFMIEEINLLLRLFQHIDKQEVNQFGRNNEFFDIGIDFAFIRNIKVLVNTIGVFINEF